MSRSLTFQLHELVHSLNKGEKRHFKLYAQRNTQKKESKFIQLFQLLDKMVVFDEQKVEEFLSRGVSNKSKLKSHLYQSIMTSLHLLNKDKLEFQIREQISYAQLLYRKGLYKQATAQLERAKKLALDNEQLLQALEILKYEKLIKTKTIKGNHYKHAVDLTYTSQTIQAKVEEESFWSDFSLKLYNHYLKIGHVRNSQEFESIRSYFINCTSRKKPVASTFHGELCRIQSHVWYHYIVQDFSSYFRYSLAWVEHFEQREKWQNEDFDSYMKGLYNCLVALFYLREPRQFTQYQSKLNQFIAQNKGSFMPNTDLNAFFYSTVSRINLYIAQGEYQKGYNEIPKIYEELTAVEDKLDAHRRLSLLFKLGKVCFGASRFKEALHYFNLIDQSKANDVRNDIHCYSRILSLLAHFEIQNDYLIEYQIKSTYRFLLKMESMDNVERAILSFLQSTLSHPRAELLPRFLALQKRLLILSKDQFSRRAFLYMDLMAWLQSNIEKRNIEEIVKEGLTQNHTARQEPLVSVLH